MNNLTKILTICVSTSILNIHAQEMISYNSFVKNQNIIFKTDEFNYKFTMFLGKIYGSVSSITEKKLLLGFYPGFNNMTQDTLAIFKFEDNKQIKNIIRIEHADVPVDTIHSYFSIQNTNCEKNFVKEKIKDNEVKYSYILQQLDEPILRHSNHNRIRIIEPLEDLNICTEYMILEIHFFADSAKIYKTNCKIKGFEGIQVTEKDSFLLKKRHVKNLLKHLKKVRTANIKNKECRNIGNPSILEYNFENEYDNFIFSYYCKRENKKAIPDEVWDLHSYLGTLRIKYFGRLGSK